MTLVAGSVWGDSLLDARFCSCTQLVLREDWRDHQMVCPRRRYTCPAFVGDLSGTSKSGYDEYFLSLSDSDCPPPLKELAKLRVLKNLRGITESLSEESLPPYIVQTLRVECPTFSSKSELHQHLHSSCPFWKVNRWPHGWKRLHYQSRDEDSRGNTGLSRCSFLDAHSFQMSLDPISHRSEPIRSLYPYQCPRCGNHFPEKGTHLCGPPFSLDPPPPGLNDPVLCPCCKTVLANPRKRGGNQVENTCPKCNDQLLVSDLKMTSLAYHGSSVLCPGCKRTLVDPRKSGGQLVENTCLSCDGQDSDRLAIALPCMTPHPSSKIWSGGIGNQQVMWHKIKGELTNFRGQRT